MQQTTWPALRVGEKIRLWSEGGGSDIIIERDGHESAHIVSTCGKDSRSPDLSYLMMIDAMNLVLRSLGMKLNFRGTFIINKKGEEEELDSEHEIAEFLLPCDGLSEPDEVALCRGNKDWRTLDDGFVVEPYVSYIVEAI